MELKHLRYLVEVAKTNSLSKAAENLLISQPCISNGIKQLETEFNFKILDKNNRGVKLTVEGMDFLENAKYILRQIDNLENIYSLPSRDKIFHLKISSDIVFNLGNLISKVFESITEKYIKFSVKESFREEVILDVAQKKANIGFISLYSIDESVWKSLIEINKLEFFPIKKENMYVYVGKNNRLYNKEKIIPKDLKNLTRIHLIGKTNLAIRQDLYSDMLELLKEEKILYLNDKETISKVLETSNTYTLATAYKDDYNRKTVKAIPLVSKENLYTTIGWIKLKDTELTQESKVFLNEFLNSLKEEI